MEDPDPQPNRDGAGPGAKKPPGGSSADVRALECLFCRAKIVLDKFPATGYKEHLGKKNYIRKVKHEPW